MSGLTAIILLAGRGTRIADLTSKPKCLLEIQGKSLLHHHFDAFVHSGIEKVVLVLGYLKEQITEEVEAYTKAGLEILCVTNEDYINKGNTYSMLLGLEASEGGVLVIDGDLIYDPDILKAFVAEGEESSILVGEASLDDIECSKTLCDDSDYARVFADKREVTPEELEIYNFAGEATGVLKFSQQHKSLLLDETIRFLDDPQNINLNWEFVMNIFMKNHDLGISKTQNESWIEIDNQEDYQNAKKIFSR